LRVRRGRRRADAAAARRRAHSAPDARLRAALSPAVHARGGHARAVCRAGGCARTHRLELRAGGPLTQLRFLCAAAQRSAFQQIWSLKEALVKARGDGLAYELSRAAFSLGEHGAASVLLDDAPQPNWCDRRCGGIGRHALMLACRLRRAFTVQQLGPTREDGAHWARMRILAVAPGRTAHARCGVCLQVTVARCRPGDVVDAAGGFRATLLVRTDGKGSASAECDVGVPATRSGTRLARMSGSSSFRHPARRSRC
jgi:hypothetical protein